MRTIEGAVNLDRVEFLGIALKVAALSRKLWPVSTPDLPAGTTYKLRRPAQKSNSRA